MARAAQAIDENRRAQSYVERQPVNDQDEHRALHTHGSVALLHRETLFTGDHLWASDDEDGLESGRDVCWYSWPEM